MINRYAHLPMLVRKYRPSTICEVGTGSADNAVAMCKMALRFNDRVSYTGYDVFEKAGLNFDTMERNFCERMPMMQAANKLQTLHRRHKGFSFALHRGTSKTKLPNCTVDFAVIDGGHMVETIAADYDALKRSRVIVLTHFYLFDARRRCPDQATYGCNSLIEKLRLIRRVQFLPCADPMPDGGLLQMVLVAR